MMPNPDQVQSLARYHSFALEHYDKFLQGASRAHLSLMTKDHARRMTMIACLLVVCVENIQYHYQNAVTHAQKGLHLMRALSNSGVDNGMKSPVPDIVEDELIHQFHRMELTIMTVYDARIPSVHSQLKEDGDMTVKNMPHTFTLLSEASQYFVLIMRRTYHFIANALADNSPYTTFRDFSSVLNPNSNLSNDFTTWLRDAPDELQVEQEKYAAENRRWAQAFEPLLCFAYSNYEQQDSVRLLLLKLHSVTLTVRLAGHLSKTELIYDNFTPEFRKIVDLATSILNHPHADTIFAGGAFNFDMCVVYPIVTAGLFCRDRRLRREAISLLAKKDWREAQFSSKTSAAVAIFLMECEEDGVETDYIPEWARARLSGVDADLESRVMTMQCIRGVGESATRIERTVYC
jgi:hypothetical protein